jgi:hypothetical protein
MSNRISLGDIESRLGKPARPQSNYDDYAPLPASQQAQAYDDDDSESTLSAGFIATCVAAFVAVGGGTYFMTGGDFDWQALTSWKKNGVYTDFQSVVDARCRRGWGADRENRDQLHCYLSHNIARLCDPQERGHLLNVVQAFQDGAMLNGAVTMTETFKLVGNQGKMMQIGMAGAKASQEGISIEQQGEAIGKVTGMVDEAMSGITGQIAKNRNAKSMDDLKLAMRKLASRGYISEADFGWLKPDWIKSALSGVKAPANGPCKSAG